MALYPLRNYKLNAPTSRVSEILRINDIVLLLVDALQKPCFSATAAEEPRETKDARRDLYNLAITSTDFFYPCMEATWSAIFDIKQLLAMLLRTGSQTPEDLHGGELGTQPSSERTSLQEDASFTHFRYYAGCVTHLKILAHDYSQATLASALSRMPPGLCHLFPRLQELIWLEGEACLLHGDIGSILKHSASLDNLTLRFDHSQHTSLGDITFEHQSFCRDAVIHLCATVSRAKPVLKRLVLDVPRNIPIPCSVLAGFDDLKCVEILACINGDSSLDGPILSDRPQLSSVEHLEVLWTPDCNLRSLPQDVSLSNVHYLAVRSMEQEAEERFPADVALLTTLTTAHLTVVEVYFLNLSGTALYHGSFHDLVAPLTARASLQHVSFILTGYCFEFTAHDLLLLTRAWPALQVLNLSFEVVQHSTLPDLQDAIPQLLRQCPLLQFLHLPAIATFVNPDRGRTFTIPYVPHNQLRHLSSDVFNVQHAILDVAFGLRWTFPHLVCVGPPGKHTVWCEIQSLVHALHTNDYVMIFEHTARYMRDKIYVNIP